MKSLTRMVSWVTALPLLLAAPLLAQPVPGRTNPVLITLRPQAEVGCRAVTIGAIADIEGDNPSLCKAIASLDLADPPANRTALQITRKQVAFRLELSDLPRGSYRLEGAEVTTVTMAHYVPPESEILAIAMQAVKARLNASDPEDYQIQLARPIVLQTTVAGLKEDISLRAQLHNPTAPTVGHIQVDINVFACGELKLSFAVHLDVNACPKVAVATRAIEKGEGLSGAAIRIERRPVDGLQGYIVSADALVAKRARRALTPGQVVLVSDTDLLDDTSERILVHQHDPVKLLVRLGAINIIVNGEAQENGRLGQLIKVVNMESKKIVLGRVTERSLVEVDP
jgi:flagellar basal body P-ring formation protein FlgA